MRKALGWLAFAALLASCSATQDIDTARQAAAAKATLDTLWTRYAEAADRRDSLAFRDLFTLDGSIVFSNAPTIRGRAAVGDFLTALHTGVDVTAFRVIPDDMRAAGPLAVQSGWFEEDFTEAGTQRTEVGRYMIMIEQTPSEGWRIRRLVALADSVRTRG